MRKYPRTGIGKPWTMDEMRSVALGAARSRLMGLGIDPLEADADSALNTLDDALRQDPDLIASIWYNFASDGTHQFQVFRREWRKWQQEAKEREAFLKRFATN